MEKIILTQYRNENPEEEVNSEDISEIIHDSLIKKFFLEVASITVFTWHFFKEYLNRRMSLMN